MANASNKPAASKQTASSKPAASKPSAAAKPMPSSNKPGIFTRMGKFLRETWIELKKTSWPNQDELKKGTLLVLAAVGVVAVWICGLDYIFGVVLKKLGLA
ncbi:MAG TPA: preprotein translocase subunit SecE [Armatimonadota bacterium]|jgi:preprotein translocase subunit SecE